MLLLSLFDMILLYASEPLLFIPNVKWHNVTEAKIQSTTPHLIELLRRRFLGNSPNTTNQLFFKKLFGW